MGARIESLPIPVIRPRRKGSWLVAGVLALFMAAGAASFLALRNASDEASVPAQSQFSKSGPVPAITGTGNGLIEVANSSANLTGHSLVYFTGAGSAPQVAGRGWRLAELNRRLAAYRSSGFIIGTGPALAELRGVDVIVGISGTGPGLEQVARGSADCRMVRHGPC